MLIYQATKRVSQYVLKDEKEFVEQLKAQYELQCEKDNTTDGIPQEERSRWKP